MREGIGSVWVATAEPPRPEGTEEPLPRAKPAAPPQLVSRQGGAPAWSPDGRTLLVSGLPDPQPVYNGNPLRNEVEAPPLFALNARVPAVARARAAAGARGRRRRDGRGRGRRRRCSARRSIACGRRCGRCITPTGDTAGQWASARDKYRPRATAAKNDADLETSSTRWSRSSR